MKDIDIPARLGISDYEFRVVIGRTKIDYDTNKEMINRQKHGYSLESAVHLLEKFILFSKTPFVTSDAIKEGDEIRHKHMGIDDKGKTIFMVTTMRPDETVRIISFRRASDKECELFYRLTR
jgi:uncharacterized DUF497 family protein